MSADNDKYNGWTNRETWLVKLWIDNEEGSQRYWIDQTRESWSAVDVWGDIPERPAQSIAARSELEARLQGHFDDAAYELLDDSGKAASFWADLLGTALGRVNWREIAAAMLDDAELEGYEPHKG